VTSSHEIVYYRCGHLAYQCRCAAAADKPRRTLAAQCPTCTAALRDRRGLPGSTARK
jgi:hypothetical protein